MGDLLAELGAVLGPRYALRAELGSGGMSRVFLAEERALGRRVVIKVLARELSGPGAADRFRREILLSAQLQHPHIVPVLAAGEVDGAPYFIMPFIEGQALRAWIDAHPRPDIPSALRTLRDVSAALAHAHARGVVHRDIKPENVLLSGGIAVVADFGVAKALGATGIEAARDGAPGSPGTGITSAGFVVGTPAYMAPEQAAGDPATDHRADIYAFGVLAFELLSGRTPFGERSAAALLRAHAVEPIPPLSQLRRDVPHALSDLIERCLEKHPADRPQTALEVMRVLESGAARRPGRRSSSAYRKGAGVAAATVLAAFAATMGGLGGFARAGSSSEPPVTILLAGIEAGEREAVLADIFEEIVRERIGGAFRLASHERISLAAAATSDAAATLAINDARRLALHGGVSAVVTGSVEALGAGNSFTLWAVDPGSGDLLVAVRETSPDGADAMKAMARAEGRFERWLLEAFGR